MSDTNTGPSQVPAAASRGLKTFLIASLAINLLFAGLAAGSAFKWRHHRGAQNVMGSEIALRSFLRTLPKERASELRKAIRQQGKPDMQPLIGSLRDARRSAADALAVEPFDRAKIESAFAAIDTADAALKSSTRQALLAAASKMTAEERKALVEHWKARRPKLFGGKDDDRQEPSDKE